MLRQGFNQPEGLLGEGALFRYASAGNGLSHIQTISGADYLEIEECTTLDVRKSEETSVEEPVNKRITYPIKS